MKRLAKFQPSLITETFFTGIHPRYINSGQCFQWAYLTFLTFKGVTLWDMGAHAFVKRGNLFYDAERLHGERDWKDLPATNWGAGCGCWRCKRGAGPRKPFVFVRDWKTQCVRFNTSWTQLEQQAKQLVETYGRMLRT